MRNGMREISSLVASFDRIGLKSGDHLVTVLQNCEAAATLHWACQLAGIIVTPVNWRAKAEELDYYIEDSEARAVVSRTSPRRRVEESKSAPALPRKSIRSGRETAGAFEFRPHGRRARDRGDPRVSAEAWSMMLYTSGTTSRPKGVPRRHRAERAAALRMSRKIFTGAANGRSA